MSQATAKPTDRSESEWRIVEEEVTEAIVRKDDDLAQVRHESIKPSPPKLHVHTEVHEGPYSEVQAAPNGIVTARTNCTLVEGKLLTERAIASLGWAHT